MPKEETKKTARKAVKKAVAGKAAAGKAVRKAVVKDAAIEAPVEKAVKKVARKAVKKTVRKSVKTLTTVIAKIDAGFGNEVYIRGNGAGLKWDAGVPMENRGADEWVWSSTAVTSELEFKVLINDSVWTEGPNGVVFPGATVVFEPGF